MIIVEVDRLDVACRVVRDLSGRGVHENLIRGDGERSESCCAYVPIDDRECCVNRDSWGVEKVVVSEWVGRNDGLQW